jgi:hypothetical protein
MIWMQLYLFQINLYYKNIQHDKYALKGFTYNNLNENRIYSSHGFIFSEQNHIFILNFN